MPHSKPKISVIIPTYNCERYIADTIASILGQTFNDLELIVIDDGSTDRTREIVASHPAPVRLITQENAGVCAARNRGIREAAGEFICLMDHDDYWFPDKLALQLKQFEVSPEVGVVYASFILWHAAADGSFPVPATFNLDKFPDGVDKDFSGWIYHQFLLDCWMLTSTAMFRRDVFDKCGIFDESLPYSEDWDLWLRIAREFEFVMLNRPNTLYRQHLQQGNRVVRDIDYRTVLLENAVRKWGYCSRDGRCVSRARFSRQLADYHASYALLHLRSGNKFRAMASFIKAWRANPLKLRFLVYIPLGVLGWKPQ